jgi:hypothetical protein
MEARKAVSWESGAEEEVDVGKPLVLVLLELPQPVSARAAAVRVEIILSLKIPYFSAAGRVLPSRN